MSWFKQHSALNNLSNTDYIQAIYQNTFGELPTAEVLSQNLLRLDGNTIGREALATEMASSSDATTHLANTIFLHEGWI